MLYNLINIQLIERTREIASLKVLGFDRREVAAYLFRETLLLVIAGALIGLALSAAGYDGLQAVQSASAISCIRIVFVVLPLVLYVLLLVLMYFYKLDAQLPQIREELDRKNNA